MTNKLSILQELLEKESKEANYQVEQFVLENREEGGELVLTLLEENLPNKHLSILNAQALPYISDDTYLKALEMILQHKNANDRLKFFIIQKIGWRGKYAKKFIPHLTTILESNIFLKRITAIALSELDFENYELLIPHLIDALNNEADRINRLSAARQLLKYEKLSKEAIPALVNAMKNDKEFQVRQKIVHYFGEIERTDVLPEIKAVKDTDSHTIVRSVAMRVIDDLTKKQG